MIRSIKKSIDSDHGIYRDLRNVVANYPFESSHRFAGIQPNSGHRDHSRLSCDLGETQLGPNARISAGMLARTLVIELAWLRRHELPRFLPIQKCSGGSQSSNTIAHWTLSAKGACVVITDTDPDRVTPWDHAGSGTSIDLQGGNALYALSGCRRVNAGGASENSG